MVGPFRSDDEKARVVVPVKVNAARIALREHVQRLNQAYQLREASMDDFSKKYFGRNSELYLGMQGPWDDEKLVWEIRHLRHIIQKILAVHPNLHDMIHPKHLPKQSSYLTDWRNASRARDRAEMARTAHERTPTQTAHNAGSSQVSHSHFVKRLCVFPNHGSSSVPTVRKRGCVSTSQGKQRMRYNNNHIPLYHVVTRNHNVLKLGDTIQLSGKTWWHSDPGFRWRGRANKGYPGARSVLKMIVPRERLTTRRSTTDHNTNIGTTFVMDGMNATIQSIRKISDGVINEITIIPINTGRLECTTQHDECTG